jgi:hypothetical protein
MDEEELRDVLWWLERYELWREFMIFYEESRYPAATGDEPIFGI